MKRIISLIALIAICAFTATISANANSNAAKKVLDKAVAKLNIKGGTTASFSITGNKIGTQKGSISIKGNKFHASTASAIVWYNGKTQWTYVKKNEEVNVSTPSAACRPGKGPRIRLLGNLIHSNIVRPLAS